MAALARLLERFLCPARKEEEAEDKEEKDEGLRASDPSRSLLAPRCAQRPYKGAAASWGLRFGRAQCTAGARTWRTRIELGSRYPGCPRAGLSLLPTATAGREPPSSARATCRATCSRRWAPAPREPEGVCRALRLAFLRADAHLRSLWPRGEPGGSPAVALLVSSSFLYLEHCGDSSAVLSRAGSVAFSAEDHRPLRTRECERLHDTGGTIHRRRFEGSLAVSRTLGDFAYKEDPGRPPELQLVSAEPEVTALERQVEDEFIILASDGMWDAMSGAALAD